MASGTNSPVPVDIDAVEHASSVDSRVSIARPQMSSDAGSFYEDRYPRQTAEVQSTAGASASSTGAMANTADRVISEVPARAEATSTPTITRLAPATTPTAEEEQLRIMKEEFDKMRKKEEERNEFMMEMMRQSKEAHTILMRVMEEGVPKKIEDVSKEKRKKYPILSNKAIRDMKTWGSKDCDMRFKRWNEKLQALLEDEYEGARAIMKWAQNIGLGSETRMLTMTATEIAKRIAEGDDRDLMEAEPMKAKIEAFNKDLHKVLDDKTDGEALSKLKNCEWGEGIQGYMRIYRFFSKIGGEAMSSRRIAVMEPKPVKKSSELVEAVEVWERHWKEVKEMEEADMGPDFSQILERMRCDALR